LVEVAALFLKERKKHGGRKNSIKTTIENIVVSLLFVTCRFVEYLRRGGEAAYMPHPVGEYLTLHRPTDHVLDQTEPG
jgi:hypothetical protein